MKNIKFLIFISFTLMGIIFISCAEKEKPLWKVTKNIDLPNFNATGISAFKTYVTVSDSSRDIVYIIDTLSNSIFKEVKLESPVYINMRNSRLLIPSKGLDSAFVYRGSEMYALETFGILDGCVGVDASAVWHYAQVSQNDNLVHYKNGTEEYLIGSKGSEQQKLNSPSNVMIIDSMIYVVDSGNNRIQVYNVDGEFDFSFGEELLMKWPTGISCSDKNIFISDAILNEILVFDYNGKYIYSIKEGINGPSDIEYKNDYLFVANLKGHPITMLKYIGPKEEEINDLSF